MCAVHEELRVPPVLVWARTLSRCRWLACGALEAGAAPLSLLGQWCGISPPTGEREPACGVD